MSEHPPNAYVRFNDASGEWQIVELDTHRVLWSDGHDPRGQKRAEAVALYMQKYGQITLLESPEPPVIICQPVVDREVKVTHIEAAVIRQIENRATKGQQKYGVGMDRTDLGILEWLQHAQEEALDFAIYLERLKEEYRKRMDL